MDELNNTVKDYCFCKVFVVGKHQFEVQDRFTRFVVNLEGRTCFCNGWTISGLPCKHSTTCVLHIQRNIKDYYDKFHGASMYQKAYSYIVAPLLDLNTLKEVEVFPLPLTRLPRRLRKSRKRQQGEALALTRARRSSIVKCNNCKELGHNLRDC